jgi:hypothetical protein
MEEAPPRAGTVQPLKSLPLNSDFQGSADRSDTVSPKQNSANNTNARRFPFI